LSMPEDLSKDNAFVIMGEEDVVGGFRALGFKAYALKEQAEFMKVLDEIVRSKMGICLVQDNFYSANEVQINSYKNLPFPIFIPFHKNIEHDLLEGLIKDIRMRATGAI